MYSDGKRYLEGIVYLVKTASFSVVNSVIKSLLEKQKEQKIDSLSVCASGTRQHLYEAFAELSGEITVELDDALLTVFKQNAYEFMADTPPQVYVGNEMHLNASLVNFAYKKFGLIPNGKNKIEDQSAYPPQDDRKIFVSNNIEYRGGFTKEEAERFVENINPMILVQALIARLTIRYHRDMRSISSYDGARFFLEKLINIADVNKDKHDIIQLQKKIFGYYHKKKLEYQNEWILNEAQIQEINDYGISVVLSQLESHYAKGSSLYLSELGDLCDALSRHPEIDREKISKNVLQYYDTLKDALLSKTIIKQLDPSGRTTDKAILKYVHHKLSQLKPAVEEKQEKRAKLAHAALQRLGKEKKIEKIEHKECEQFGTARVMIDPAEVDSTIIIDNSHYCSLDQILKDDKSATTAQTPEETSKALYETVLFLMLDGGHLNADKYLKIQFHKDQNVTLCFLPDCLELSWVSHATEGTEKRILFPDYFKKLDSEQQLVFFKEIFILSEWMGALFRKKLLAACLKHMSPINKKNMSGI